MKINNNDTYINNIDNNDSGKINDDDKGNTDNDDSNININNIIYKTHTRGYVKRMDPLYQK